MKIKLFVSAISILLSALFLNCVALATEDASQYQETILNLAKSEHATLHLIDFTAGPNGYVNYFITTDRDNNILPPKQYQSRDYGQTWSEVSMDWFSQKNSTSPKYGKAEIFHVADNGDIYFMAHIGRKEQVLEMDGEKVTVNPAMYGIFKYDGSKIQQIPNLQLGNYYQPAYTIGHVFENGDILIERLNSERATRETTGFSVYGADGRLKKEVSLKGLGWLPSAYSQNTVYGIYEPDNNGPKAIAFCNTQTGQKDFIPLSKNQTTRWPSTVGASKDGTVYVAFSSGLYKCKPGETSFKKVIGGEGYHLSINASTGRFMACANDGTVYVQAIYINESNMNDPKNDKEGKLCRYSPVTK